MAGTVNLEELERVAMAATPGPWSRFESLVLGPGTPSSMMDVADCALGSEPEDIQEWAAALADADHIAANSPPVTLALIARIRDLEAALRSEHSLADAVALAADSEWEAQHAANAAVFEKGVVLP